MTVHALDFFRDENPGVFRSNPLMVITSASRSAFPQLNPFGDDSHDRPGARRVVFYNDEVTGEEVRLALRFHQHLGGSWTNLTNTDQALFTPTNGATEGRLVYGAGTMAAVDAEDVWELKGVLFAEYFTPFLRSRRQAAQRVTSFANGDWYWVVVGGLIPLQVGASGVTADRPIITDADGHGGRVQSAIAIAATVVGITENSWQKNIGIPFQTVAEGADPTANFANCLIDLDTWGSRED